MAGIREYIYVQAERRDQRRSGACQRRTHAGQADELDDVANCRDNQRCNRWGWLSTAFTNDDYGLVAGLRSVRTPFEVERGRCPMELP